MQIGDGAEVKIQDPKVKKKKDEDGNENETGKKKHIQESDDAKLKIYDSLEKMLLGEGGRGRKKLKKHSQK